MTQTILSEPPVQESLAAESKQRPVVLIAFAAVWLALASTAHAQGGDFTVFVGRAFPTYDERLTLRPAAPSIPGLDVSVAGDPAISADGGLVFGGALAFELGILGIEGRLDATDVGFDVTGARYDVRVTQPPFQGVTGTITIGDGRLDADRLYLLSGNVRLRTPGPIGLVASGGVSLLPDITISGSVPLAVQLGGVAPPGIAPRLRLRGAPGESERRLGLNGGAGLRIGGRRMSLLIEARAFYFREYELRFDAEGAPDLLRPLLNEIGPIRFDPVIVNVQAGLVFRF